MANERFSSLLISEGTLPSTFGSVRSTIIAAVVLLVLGLLLVWGAFLLLASA